MDTKVKLIFRDKKVHSYDVHLRNGKVYTIPEYAGEILIKELQRDSNRLYRLDKDYYRGYDILSLTHGYMSFADLTDIGKREILIREPDLFKDNSCPELEAEIKRIKEKSKDNLLERYEEYVPKLLG